MADSENPVRVLFMGGKAVGCGVLNELIDSPIALVCGAIVNPSDTQEDRWFPSATELAMRSSIPVIAPEDINSDESTLWIRSHRPDIIVIAYFDQILSQPVFGIPPLGTVNLHLALAEKYRGCYPTTWAIINGETVTGVTIHQVTEEVDGGDIFADCKVPIELHDTGLSLYEKCGNAGISLFADVLPKLLTGRLVGRPQRKTPETKYYRREFPSHEVKFEGDAESTLNYIRALHFPPFPAPFIKLGDKKLEIVSERNL